MLLQLLFVLVAIIVGARLGGIGLGVMGGVGLAILTFVFGLQPTARAGTSSGLRGQFKAAVCGKFFD